MKGGENNGRMDTVLKNLLKGTSVLVTVKANKNPNRVAVEVESTTMSKLFLIARKYLRF